MDYHELNKALRRGGDQAIDPSLKPGAGGSIELKSKNKSSSSPKAPPAGKTGFSGQLAANINTGKFAAQRAAPGPAPASVS